jgi:hypothetical protein
MASRQFSLHSVLRLVPNPLLRELFVNLGHPDFDPGWLQLKEREIRPIVDYLESLPPDKRDEIEGALRSAAELASDRGMESLIEACSICGESSLAEQLPDYLSVWGRAMFMWLRHRTVFDTAQIIFQVDHMAWWRKRSDLPRNLPDCSPAAISQLQGDISALLKAQGRGKDCTVELFRRGEVDYFCAFPDDFVQNVLVHDEDHMLSPATFRRTLQIVFAYDRRDGSLETCAKLAKPIKEQLEVVFAKAILHWDLDAYDSDAAYELDQLKDAWFDLATDPADQLQVRIRKLRLSGKHCGRRVLIEVDDSDPTDHIHKAIEECVDLKSSPLSEWHATLATFCFEFLPKHGRKPGRQSFDVGYPRSCSLRNARPERVEIIQKYLKRWKIDCGQSTPPDLVSMGR